MHECRSHSVLDIDDATFWHQSSKVDLRKLHVGRAPIILAIIHSANIDDLLYYYFPSFCALFVLSSLLYPEILGSRHHVPCLGDKLAEIARPKSRAEWLRKPTSDRQPTLTWLQVSYVS